MNSIFFYVLALRLIFVRGLALCPAPHIDISPCNCIGGPNSTKPSSIQCFGEESVDLSQVFEILDANIGPENKNFKTFYLNNSFIEEIPENLFKGLTFEEIIIEKTNKLSKISENSFKGLENRLKHLHLKDTKLSLNSHNYSDIQAFDGLKNLELSDFSSSECPPSRLFGPKCKCYLFSDPDIEDTVKLDSAVIQCSQVVSSEELFTVFDGLNTQLTGNERNFFRFHLKESKIEELPENLFKGITFSEIVLEDCHQLNHIDRNVFETTQPFINRLSITNIDLKNETETTEDILYAITGLPNLVSLDLVNVFDEIPDKAFRRRNNSEIQRRFKLFSHSGYETPQLEGHRIKRIGRYAFNDLPNIEIIDFQKNLIEIIDRYSFANQMPSDKRLLIRLGRNKLNQSSFSVGSFAGSQRPIKLELGQLFVGCNRDILYLEEAVFSGFLDKPGNELDLGCAYVMQCDCKMRWLYDGPQFWRSKIRTGGFGETVIPCELDTEDGIEEVSIWNYPEEFLTCNSKISVDYYENEKFESVANNTVEDEDQEVIED